MRLSIFVLLLLGNSVFAAAPAVGQKSFTFKDTTRDRSLKAYVWYPADSNSKVTSVPDGPFAPSLVALDAPMEKAKEKLPLVMLSHGSGGTAGKMFWLAEVLVKNRMIVLAVDHPGNMKGDNSADGMIRVWERPADMRFALDQLILTDDLKDRIDQSKIAAAGFSAGGTAVLLMGGARLAVAQFANPVPNCASTDDPYYAKICEQLKKIDLKKYPKSIVEKSHADPRVKAVVAFDPGFARGFNKESLNAMSAKPLVFIADKLREPADEIYSRDFLTMLPSASKLVAGSVHMSFLSACKPKIPLDIPELKSLCGDRDNKLRIQKDAAEQTIAFFRTVWSASSKE